MMFRYKPALLFFICLFALLDTFTAFAKDIHIPVDSLGKYQFNDHPSYSIETLDDSTWPTFEFSHKKIPHDLDQQNRILWVRQRFTVPTELRDESLMLYLGSITNGHEVYMNGHLLGKSLSTTQFFNDWNRKHAYRLPSEWLYYGRENVLAIKTYSNYEYGPGEHFFIGSYNQVLHRVQLYNTFFLTLYFALSISLILIALYFFSIYMKTRITKKHIYFSLICGFASIYYTNYYVYAAPFSYFLFQKIIFTSLHLFLIFFLPFLKEFLNQRFNAFDKWLCIVELTISFVGALFAPSLQAYYIFRTYYITFMLINIFYYVWLCIKALRSKNNTVLRLGAGLLCLLTFTFHDMYYEIIGQVPAIGVHLNGYALIVFLIFISFDLVKEYNELYLKASTDGLTGLYHQNYLKNALNEIFMLRKEHEIYSFILCDIDFFKKFNDTYGHLMGDHVIREVAKVLKNNSPKNALVARYGGEEFAVLLRNADAAQATELAEKLRHSLEEYPLCYKETDIVHVTISIGVSTTSAESCILHSEIFIEQADQALYHSKDQGRNRVTHYEKMTPSSTSSLGSVQKGLALCDFKDNKPILLIIEKRAGTSKVNTCLRNALPILLEPFHIIHICGKENVDPTLQCLSGYVQYELMPEGFMHIFAAGDLVISRAAAQEIGELIINKKPTILIPSSASTDPDSITNAKAFSKQGFGKLILEQHLTEDTLIQGIIEVYKNKEQYIQKMNSKSLPIISKDTLKTSVNLHESVKNIDM